MLPVAMESMGVQPEDIDFLFLTHLHGDHIGGMLKDGAAVFPNAEVYVSKAEYDGWMAMPEGQNANFDMDKPVATASRIMILDYARENGLTMAGMI